jgi:probable phosphoglycerate mutase
MTTLLLIRHGHTDAAGRRLTGRQRGVHLSPRGLEEAERLVERLAGVPVDAIWTSPLERCRETAAPLARSRGLAPVAHPGLLEVDYGDWSGRSIAQVRRTRLWRAVMLAPSAVRFPGGESLLEVQSRMVDATAALVERHPGGTVVAVSHADPIRLLVAHLVGAHADHLQRITIDTASITAFALADGTVPRLLTVNHTADLAWLRPRRGKVRG